MRSILLPVSAVLLLSIAACGKDESPVQSSEPVDQPAPVAVPPGIRVVHSKVGSGKGTAIALVAGQSISGETQSGSGGELAAFGVRIGNYFNSSNGSLALTLCVDDACQDSSAPLSGSKDNDYLVFQLSQPVAVSPEQTIKYTLTRSSDAKNRVAIWAYPAREGQIGFVGPQGTSTDFVPRLALHFHK